MSGAKDASAVAEGQHEWGEGRTRIESNPPAKTAGGDFMALWGQHWLIRRM